MSPEAKLEEKVAKMEGTLEHLATKADVAELRGEMRVLLVIMTAILTLLNIALRVWQ